MFLASILAQSFGHFVQFAHQLPVGRSVGEEEALTDVSIPRATPSLEVDLIFRSQPALTVAAHTALQYSRLVQNARFRRIGLKGKECGGGKEGAKGKRCREREGGRRERAEEERGRAQEGIEKFGNYIGR